MGKRENKEQEENNKFSDPNKIDLTERRYPFITFIETIDNMTLKHFKNKKNKEFLLNYINNKLRENGRLTIGKFYIQ